MSRPSKLRMARADLEGLPVFPPLPAGVALIRADFAQVHALAAVLADAFQDARWDAALVHKLLLDDPTVQTTFLLTVDGVPAATASLRALPERFPRAAYVHWVGTAAAHAGRGLGRLVNLAVLHEGRRRACGWAVLETDDFRTAAIRTYRGLGFQPVLVDDSHPARWAAIHRSLESSR